MTFARRGSLLLLLLAAAVALPAPRPAAAQPAVPPSKFVSADWLQKNLARPDVRVVDMREDLRKYWESHLPSAVFLDFASLRWPAAGVPMKLLPPAAFATLLGALGIGRDTTVVIYSEVNHYRAAYFAWALDAIAHPRWAILEGGFDGWQAAGRPVTQDYPALKAVDYPVPALDPAVVATLEEIRDRDRSKAAVVDARDFAAYVGEKGTWKRKGHIRGAVHRFWAADVLESGASKDREVLLAAYAAIGITPEKRVFVTCGQGLMSSHSYVTLRYRLGFPRVENYDGGFSEWSADDSVQVVSGRDARGEGK